MVEFTGKPHELNEKEQLLIALTQVEDLTNANLRYKHQVEQQRRDISELNFQIGRLYDDRAAVLGPNGAALYHQLKTDLEYSHIEIDRLRKVLRQIAESIPNQYHNEGDF